MRAKQGIYPVVYHNFPVKVDLKSFMKLKPAKKFDNPDCSSTADTQKRHAKISLTLTPTSTPQDILSNPSGLSYHNTSLNRYYGNILGIPVNRVLPLAIDEPASNFSATYDLQLSSHENTTLKWGLGVNHLKINEFNSGLYLSRGDNLVGPLFAVQFTPSNKGLASRFGGEVSVLAGGMFSEPTFQNNPAPTKFTNLTPFAPGGQDYQFVGVGLTVTPTLTFEATNWLALRASYEVHMEESRRLNYSAGGHDQIGIISGAFTAGAVFSLPVGNRK